MQIEGDVSYPWPCGQARHDDCFQSKAIAEQRVQHKQHYTRPQEMREINEESQSLCSNHKLWISENVHAESPHTHDTESQYAHDCESIFKGGNTCEKGFHFAQHIDKSSLKQRLHRSHWRILRSQPFLEAFAPKPSPGLEATKSQANIFAILFYFTDAYKCKTFSIVIFVHCSYWFLWTPNQSLILVAV